ncbi:dimethylaniline monooxygenase [N-oxide-forming] 2-like [Denticeps clupeoides]|uniref:dimethylaniline monooxygenase [N-oxide-forming] 2-like n=1 Tax=Denticeps clupeoides TaxID=299321 RepID=UPI0010A305E9|nr:dimethylaniline monooxygenase [N-oxide-forming] 2-like [Denticeps clupeoides]
MKIRTNQPLRFFFQNRRMARPRVAVIGAGAGGLVSMKCCLDEGLEPVCFESSNDIGGLWRFQEDPEPEHSSIYRSLISNISKEMSCFSDFPMPAHFPNYLHHSQMLQYLRLYAAHFDLFKYIHFQSAVRRVRQRADFSASGQWEVLVEERDGQQRGHVFHAVLVCSGHYTSPELPLEEFKGVETFPGKYSHSWEYKDPAAFCGKRVVVVGIGNSGGDVAAEISRVSAKTFLSTRTGAWVIGRMSSHGLPLDMVMITRLHALLLHLLPPALLNWAAERRLNQKYDHRLYSLLPRHRFLDRRPIINDDLPGRILVGALSMKPHIAEFRGSALAFEDGTVEQDIDAVIFCTGYTAKFPFLPPSLFAGPEGELTLYKCLFPPSLERHTLAVLGLFQATGPIMPCMELQARWATRVFTGRNHLPPERTMITRIEAERKKNMRSHSCPKMAALHQQYVPFLDDLAQEVGARPDVLKLCLSDPGLAWRVLLGPCTPYQFRLCGPDRWAGARQAIYTQWERVEQPMKTRPTNDIKPWTVPWWLLLSGRVTVILVVTSVLGKISVSWCSGTS